MPALTQAQIQALCGWRPNPLAVLLWCLRHPRPLYRQAFPDLVTRARHWTGDAFLWDDARKVTGDALAAHNQQRGTCVSHGWSSGIDYLQCSHIANGERQWSYTPVSHALIYGASRERGGFLGDEDGSTGAWAAEAFQGDGNVSNQEARDSDTDDTLAVSWGRTGVPRDWKVKAREHLGIECKLVTGLDEAKAAMMARHPVAVCSNQGFTMTRDRDGFCSPQGTWPHCMLMFGYRADRDAYALLQSWGPNVPDGPTTLGQPDCSFWVASRTIASMLKMADSFAIVDFKGWSGGPVPPPPPPPPSGLYLTLDKDVPAGRYLLSSVSHGVVAGLRELPAAPNPVLCAILTALTAAICAPGKQTSPDCSCDELQIGEVIDELGRRFRGE